MSYFDLGDSYNMQAIIILAHKNIDQVVDLGILLRSKFEVYIHFDQKVSLNQNQKKKLDQNGIKYYSFLSVNWGAWSVANATLMMMKEVVKNSKISYVHVISGQDWPIKSLNDIYNFYQNNDRIYIKIKNANGIKKSGEPIIYWQKYYFDYDKIKRKTLYGKIYHRISLLLQTVFRVNKFKKYKFDGEVYTGSQWVDLPIDVVKYLVNFSENNSKEMKIFKYGFCSDEFWMQTIIGNNEKFKNRIVNDNHRFIKWKKQHNSYPAILDESNYNEIVDSKAHFARKLDYNDSQKLIQHLKNKI